MAAFFGGGKGGGLTPWMERAVTAALWDAWSHAGDMMRTEDDDVVAVVVVAASEEEGGSAHPQHPTTSSPRANPNTNPNPNRAKLAQVTGVRPDEGAIDLSDGHVIMTCCVVSAVPGGGDHHHHNSIASNARRDDPSASAGAGAYEKKRQAAAFALVSSLRRGVVVKLADWSVARVVSGEEDADDPHSKGAAVVRLGLRVNEGRIRVVGGYGSAVGGRPVPLAESVEYRRHLQTLREMSIDRFRRAVDHCLPRVQRPHHRTGRSVPPPPPPPLPATVARPHEETSPEAPWEEDDDPPLPPLEDLLQPPQRADPERREGNDEGDGPRHEPTAHVGAGVRPPPAGGDDDDDYVFEAIAIGFPEGRGPNDDDDDDDDDDDRAAVPSRTVRSWREASELFRHILEQDRGQRRRREGRSPHEGGAADAPPRSRIGAAVPRERPVVAPVPAFRHIPHDDEEPGANLEATEDNADASHTNEREHDEALLLDATQPAPMPAVLVGLKAMLVQEEDEEEDEADDSTGGRQGEAGDEEERDSDKGSRGDSIRVETRGSPPDRHHVTRQPPKVSVTEEDGKPRAKSPPPTAGVESSDVGEDSVGLALAARSPMPGEPGAPPNRTTPVGVDDRTSSNQNATSARKSSRKRRPPRKFVDEFPEDLSRPRRLSTGRQGALVATRNDSKIRHTAAGDPDIAGLTARGASPKKFLPSGGNVTSIAVDQFTTPTRTAARTNHTESEPPPGSAPASGTKRAPPDGDETEDDSIDAFVTKFRKMNGLFDRWMGLVATKPAAASAPDGTPKWKARNRMPGNGIQEWLNERGLLQG